MAAIAMTEPGPARTWPAIAPRGARRRRQHYIVNGAKTFITNGMKADLVVTAVRTDPELRHRGMTLLVLERGMAGFERGRNLEKLGQKAQDTAELFFDDVRVPAENLLGGGGRLRLARQTCRRSACRSRSPAARCPRGAVCDAGVRPEQRRPSGSRWAAFQNSRFVAGRLPPRSSWRSTSRRLRPGADAGELTAEDAAKAKWWCTELQGRAVDKCLQLHGGYGYMNEYPSRGPTPTLGSPGSTAAQTRSCRKSSAATSACSRRPGQSRDSAGGPSARNTSAARGNSASPGRLPTRSISAAGRHAAVRVSRSLPRRAGKAARSR